MTRTASQPRNVTGYRFLDKDPIVDLLRTAMASRGTATTKLATDAELSTTTIYNIDYGKTRRPTHNTTRSIMGALGYDEVWVTHDGHRLKCDYEAKGRDGRVKAANGKGWHTIETIHPKRPKKKAAKKAS